MAEYLRRAEAAGISWPLPQDMDEMALEKLLFPRFSSLSSLMPPWPDWVEVHQELRPKGVTLFLLWQEYKTR